MCVCVHTACVCCMLNVVQGCIIDRVGMSGGHYLRIVQPVEYVLSLVS